MTHPPLEIPPTHLDVLAHYRLQYKVDLAAGRLTPLVLPWATLHWYVLLAYYLIPHDRYPAFRSFAFRVSLWTLLAAYSINLIFRFRSDKWVVCGGLNETFFLTWSAALLLCNDAQRDFKRIQRVHLDSPESQPEADENHQNEGHLNGNGNGNGDGYLNGNGNSNSHGKGNGKAHHLATKRRRHFVYKWQDCPQDNILERGLWAFDMIVSFRGVAWNFKPRGILPRPTFVQAQLDADAAGTEIPDDVPSCEEIEVLLREGRTRYMRRALYEAFWGYFFLDLIRTIMMHDPFFWGYANAPLPTWVQQNLPADFLASTGIYSVFRCAIALYSVYFGLALSHACFTLLFLGLSYVKRLQPLLGPNAEYWVYLSCNRPFYFALDFGFYGFWNLHWHQYLRAGPTICARAIAKHLRIKTSTRFGKFLLAEMVFSINGIMHAVSGITTLGESNIVRGPMSFFLMQPVGIMVEQFVWQFSKQSGLHRYITTPIRRMTNVVVFCTWLTVVGGPSICEEYARCGYWLIELVPVSPFRLMGFRVEGDSVFLYKGFLPTFYSGKSIWTTGWAL